MASRFFALPRGIPDSDTFRRVFERVDQQGSIVRADAMNCQKKMVEKITAKEADYVIGLKENQPMLLEGS